MRVLSLFDGISCGMLALQREGIPVENYDAFEIDKHAITISNRNFPNIIHHVNVFNGDFTKFKGYDILLGGSPCTYWSIAKRSRETTPDGKCRCCGRKAFYTKLGLRYCRACYVKRFGGND